MVTQQRIYTGEYGDSRTKTKTKPMIKLPFSGCAGEVVKPFLRLLLKVKFMDQSAEHSKGL